MAPLTLKSFGARVVSVWGIAIPVPRKGVTPGLGQTGRGRQGFDAGGEGEVTSDK